MYVVVIVGGSVRVSVVDVVVVVVVVVVVMVVVVIVCRVVRFNFLMFRLG